MPPSLVVAHGPGRVNLIGEHTDYNGGLALPFAIERGVTVTATAAPGDEVTVQARDLGEEDAFALADPGRPGNHEGWRAFARGTVAELAAAGADLRPAQVVVESDLPRGAGLSSSAALAAGLCLALLGLAGEAEPGTADRHELARLCSRVENDWVGAQTGLLDQLAALCGAPGRALRIDFRTLAVEPVPLELAGRRLVVLDSGAAHTHAGSGYNERRAECEAACARLGVATLSEVDPAAADALPEPLCRRARHVLTENARVEKMVAALEAGDLASAGALLDASHASLRDDYEASVPAVERAASALKAAGATGARMVGGGFGGAVLGLLGPGARAPDGALAVAPADGARVLTRR